MKLSLAAPMYLGTKALLKALAVSYTEINDPAQAPEEFVLDISGDGPALRLLPAGGLKPLYQLYMASTGQASCVRFLQAYQIARDYMVQLDRWKDYCDRLSPQTQHSDIICYLNRHLEATFLQAQTHYQRNEAIGLNLAKAEILAKKAPKAHKTIALGGDIRYLSLVEAYLQSSEPSFSAYSYYSCFHYQDIFALAPSLKFSWAKLHPFKPHYYYRGFSGIDTNRRQYDGLLMVLEADFEQTPKLQKRIERLARPVVLYQFAPGQFRLTDCLLSLQKLISQVPPS